MAARKKSSSVTRKAGSFFTKDLITFIIIMGVVALVTYILTFNAITAKLNSQIDSNIYNSTSR